MLKELISHNEDIKTLFDEGYEIQTISNDGYLLIHNVPYVNSECKIKKGTLVINLSINAGLTFKPETHVAYFIGDYPCKQDGSKIDIVINHDKTEFGDGFAGNHTLSARADYPDHYQKVKRYINIISSHPEAIDDSVTAQTFQVIQYEDTESNLHYCDTNSSRGLINTISEKLLNQKIAIIGLGGTGSYILDFVAKTHVKEIHLFDGDFFIQHNAFRSPGAASIEKLKERKLKVDYLENIYSKMHRGVHTHPCYIDENNLQQLEDMSFVFISMDPFPIKKQIMEFLIARNIPFVDTGIGVQEIDGALKAQVKVVTSTSLKNDHVLGSTSTESHEDAYDRNIQIADLNALNAILAVIKWKKVFGLFKDSDKEHFSSYVTYSNEIINDDFSA